MRSVKVVPVNDEAPFPQSDLSDLECSGPKISEPKCSDSNIPKPGCINLEIPDPNITENKKTDKRLSIFGAVKRVKNSFADNKSKDKTCFSYEMFEYLRSHDTTLNDELCSSPSIDFVLDLNHQPKCLIRNQTVILIWKAILMVLLTATVIIVPFEVAFVHSKPGNTIWIIELVIDIGFFIDIIIIFMTPYRDKSDILITNQRKIALHYIKTWFFFDLVMILPINMAKASRLIRLFRFFRFVKLLKVLRLFRYKRIFDDFVSISDGRRDASIFRLMRVWIMLFLFAHISSCVWWYVGKSQVDSSWITTYEKSRGISLSTWSEEYIVSLHWAICTLTTVGFGDIHATNVLEMLVSIIIMSASLLFLSSMTGAIESLIDISNPLKNKTDVYIMEQAVTMAQYFELPIQMKKAIFRREVKKRKLAALVELKDIIATEEQRFQILPFVYEELFSKCSLLKYLNKCITDKNCQTRLLCDLSIHFIAHQFPSNKYICTKGATIRMPFFIVEGEIKTCSNKILRQGDAVGVASLCLIGIWPFTLTTTKLTKCFFIPAQKLMDILENMESIQCGHTDCLKMVPSFLHRWAEKKKSFLELKEKECIKWKSMSGLRSAVEGLNQREITLHELKIENKIFMNYTRLSSQPLSQSRLSHGRGSLSKIPKTPRDILLAPLRVLSTFSDSAPPRMAMSRQKNVRQRHTSLRGYFSSQKT